MVPGAPPPLQRDTGQLPLFADAPPDPLVDDLKALDLDSLTPLEALNRLAELQRRAQRGR
jgi:DNA mismatch repair protein MutS